MKNERKKNEDLLIKTLLKWIISILFFKLFWLAEYVLILVPTSVVKIWLGLWIMLPNFSGEFFIYNLFSDKLEKFELQMRIFRNKLV